MNLTNLRAAVRRHTGLLSTDLVPDSIIDEYAAETLRELLDAEQWPFLEQVITASTTLGATDGKVEFTRSFFQPVSVRLLGNQGRLLTPVSETQMMEYLASPYQLKGVPTEYCVLAGEDSSDKFRIQLYPIPLGSAQVQIRVMVNLASTYSTSATDILNGTALRPALDKDQRIWEAVAYGTAVRLLVREADDSGRIAAFQAEYLSLVKRLREFYLVNKDKKQLQLGSRPDGRRASGRRRVRRWY